MELTLYQIDAFTDKVFKGNPAAVCPLDSWLADTDLQAIAAENNLDVIGLKPNFDALSKLDLRGVMVTARGKDVDFVSRFFAPKHGINEDPVTGSAHCALTPYWSGKLNKTKLNARQVSERTGYIECELKGNRVFLSGKAVKYMQGKIKF
jgi:predicted PhzF superfamily epimerase YddE/YHI9